MFNGERILIGNSIFVLGAGFSKPAGLPLGADLFSELISLSKEMSLYSELKRNIDEFVEYRRLAHGETLDESHIDAEEFISYIDINHRLELSERGTKISLSATNFPDESQKIMRYLIARIIHLAQSKMTDKNARLYKEFVCRLKPGDIIITFNYDTVLESALEDSKIAYRLFPYPHLESTFDTLYHSLRNDDEEVVLLKMHGSIDWFDKTNYEYVSKFLSQLSTPKKEGNSTLHPIFESDSFNPRMLVHGNRFKGDPLLLIYRIDNLGDYFSIPSYIPDDIPMVIPPSFHKLLFINPLVEFWRGLNDVGSSQCRLAIIGFALPPHDEYVRQPLCHMIRNFQASESFRTNLKVVDYKTDPEHISAYRDNYRFVDWEKTDCHFDGFNIGSNQNDF